MPPYCLYQHMLLSHWLYVTDGVGIFVGDNLWGFIELGLWCREATKSRYEKTPNSSSAFIFQFLFSVSCFVIMVLDTVSQAVIPVILQKLIFKQDNESATDFPVQNHSELKNIGVEKKDDDAVKAYRKKFKKRRRREKKKLTECSNDVNQPRNIDLNRPEDDSVESEEEFLDLNSAFVTLAVSRKKIHHQGSLNDAVQTGAKDKLMKIQDAKSETKYIAASERLAVQGCKLADKEHYEHSIDMFTKAIELNPIDYRFYGNRSFCYFQLGDYKRALKDADKAISLAPENPKGYFRKGEALKALKKFKRSKNAFEHVLKLDVDCEDARLELKNVEQLLEISSKDSNQFVSYQDNGQSFGNSLNSGGNTSHGNLVNSSSIDMKMDPSNPNGFSSLWIGNISADVTEQMLFSIFSA
ncbi:hypothetical protein J437_LFUL010896 [Ladona fulva]|uniref:Uncharacterized protein n=1 Tax=Ladona fulva TaxID=123851 RepID=A0A8K0P4F2_LADFU|nr:hypothetical protein J437_LFUL010896 [Ladona fulva]